MVLPKWFERTSDLPYDRQRYKVHTKTGKTHIFDDYEQVRAIWFQSKQLLSHIEVLDKETKQKGFKEKTNERKSRKN
jgi:ABC-type transporter lipoprotein component MlaA